MYSIVPMVNDFAVVQSLSCVRLCVTPWTAAHQTSLSFTLSHHDPPSWVALHGMAQYFIELDKDC